MVLQANISPLRRSYLDFYLKAIDYHTFLPSRPWVLENLVSFDREAFISRLESTFPYIPEDFKLWILEWPAKAVVGPVWPGLPSRCRPDRPWKDLMAINKLCISDFPELQPYHLDIVPAFQYSEDEGDEDVEEPEPIRVQTLVLFETMEDGWTELLGTDPNPFVKGKLIPGNIDEHIIAFEDERPSPEKAASTNYGTALTNVLDWLIEAIEADKELTFGLSFDQSQALRFPHAGLEIFDGPF